jgi:hypothetical protein
MTTVVLPDIDRSTVEELRRKIPNLSEIELPNMPKLEQLGKNAGKTADETIDRLLGRSRAPVWPWVAAAIGVAVVLGVLAAWFTWVRRPSWETTGATWVDEPTVGLDVTTPPTEAPLSTTASAGGPPAADASLTSNAYPVEEA